MDLNEAIQIMKKDVTDAYAKKYLEDLPDAIEYGTEGLIVQLLYILENCKTWKGTKAKKVKDFVRKWIKEKQFEIELNNSPGPF